MKAKKVIFWILAVLIACAAMVYQRMTGPTYPKDYKITADGSEYEFSLPRSHGGETDCPVELELPSTVEAKLVWRRFPSQETWDTLTFFRSGDTLTTSLPHQPPAGKLEYHLELTLAGQPLDLGDTENVVIRFKGAVPGWVLIPHVLMMVLTVIWSMAILFFALANMKEYRRNVGVAIIFLLIGGFVLGPIVQKFSFGQFWTGWPFGKDLTDNKVLFALIAFIPAWFLRKKTYGRWLAVVAALLMLAAYLIPHSMNGSELDLETGEVVTGSLAALLTRKRNR
jgi:hypothetical protein